MKKEPPKRLPRVESFDETRLSHPSYSIERCPECDFPEADGGFCPSCGWTNYRPDCPHCKRSRR